MRPGGESGDPIMGAAYDPVSGSETMRYGSSVRCVAVALATCTALAACGDDVTGPNDGASARVAIAFAARGVASPSVLPAGMSGLRAAESLVIEGTNGMLVLDDVRFIVAEFELDRVEDDCDDDDPSESPPDDDGCEKFEAPPAFVSLPLSGPGAVAVTQEVPADRYDELEFEIEDLDDDEEDSAHAALIAELRGEILAEFPEWPRDASVMVEGTFNPTGGAAIPFRAFFEAEIEIELELSPPLDLTGATAPRTVTVQVDPALWFRRADGTVLDLSQLDFARTGIVPEFEVEIEQGFTEIEH